MSSWNQTYWKTCLCIVGVVFFCYQCDDESQLKRVEGLSTRYNMSFKNINSSCQQNYLSMLNSHQVLEVTVGRKQGYIYVKHGESGRADFWQLKGSLCKDGNGTITSMCLVSYSNKGYIPYEALQEQFCVVRNQIPDQEAGKRVKYKEATRNTKQCCQLDESQAMILRADENRIFSGMLKGRMFIDVDGSNIDDVEKQKQIVACHGPLDCQYESYITLIPR